jgi:hypothetical protein
MMLLAGAALALAACSGSGIVLPSLTVPTAQQVTAAVIAACNFVPDAQVVAALLNANGTITSVGTLANQVCTAVIASNKSARLRGVLPTVNGVTITGHFLAASKYHK